VQPLTELFTRLSDVTRGADEGVILDPSMIAQAYIDASTGIITSRTQC